MLFSVVIPTRHRADTLAVCLERLAPENQRVAADDYEVIVTDDGIDVLAETELGTRFPEVRWTRGPCSGPAANRNHGANLATGEWIVFTDDDCVPDAGWLRAYAAAIAVGGSAVSVLEGRTYVDRPRDHPLDFSPVNEAGGRLWSCNFAIRRALFAELGGFDRRFPYNAMEDMELHFRLVACGIEPRFVPSAAVLHPWRRISAWREHSRRHMASRLILESIHPGQGFPVSAWRAFRVHARIVLTEHVPWLLRRPREMLRVVPSIWATMAEDVGMTLRQRARRSVRS